MELKFYQRKETRKGATNRLRREGMVPAILYQKDLTTQPIAICDSDFQTILRSVIKGELSTVRFSLLGENGEKIDAILKEIQYHPTSYRLLHLDFQELDPKRKVRLNVPIVLTGVADCIGIREGGTPRQSIRKMRVSCLPEHIPTRFELNISNLRLRKALKCSAIPFPEGVRPTDPTNTVAVSIVKR